MLPKIKNGYELREISFYCAPSKMGYFHFSDNTCGFLKNTTTTTIVFLFTYNAMYEIILSTLTDKQKREIKHTYLY